MTPEIHLHVLASGSKGNAAVVEGPKGNVLVDCGISRRELMRRAAELGVDMERVGAVLVTHEHSDHVSGLSVFCNHYDGPMYATAGTVAGRSYLTEMPFTLVDHSQDLELCGMHVRCFPTSHDVNDPMGFRFETGGDAVGWCTDTGYVTDEAMDALYGCRVLGLESNHDEKMLASGPYPAFLKTRIHGETGHLSNDQTAAILPFLVTSDTETVVGLHLSLENNRPSVCVRTLAPAVGAGAANDVFTEARTSDGLLTVCVATQDRPMTIW